MESAKLQAFFHPNSVAVIGASESPAKIGHTILHNLIEGGFPGAVYPINPKSAAILGRACFKNVKEIPDPVDLGVIIIPARLVPQAIEDCGIKGVKAAVVISGGFSEAGADGAALQQAVAATAARYGVRVMGPNCQGINNPCHPLCASWPLLTRRGRVAVISQSGTVGAAMMDWFSVEDLGVSSFVSLGNRADVDETDLLEYFDRDPNTRVIALYLEGVKRPEAFRAALEKLAKPLVVLKSGRTPKGRTAAESHTKSLAGSDAVYSSLFLQHQIIRAESIEEFHDFAKALAYLEPPRGNSILFITTSGGAAILATDTAEREGLDAAPLPPELAAQLEGIIPAHAIRGNPLDLTGDADAAMFAQVIQRARSYYDTLCVIFGDPVADAATVVTPAANELIVFLGGAEVERHERQLMHQRAIPVFPTPERGVRALAQLLPPARKAKPARTTFPAATGQRRPGLAECLGFMERAGFECICHRFAESPGKAVHLAYQLGFPVSLRIDSPDILHKSEAGGVRLNLQAAQEVRTAHDQMMRDIKHSHPEAVINGAVVTSMAAPGLEVILGMNRDPQFGPTLMFGLGGVGVEVFRDVALRLLPVTRDDLYAMLDEIKGAPLLGRFRGRPPVDREALVNGLERLAELALAHPDIVEIDLNPVFAYAEGMLVVDARIIRS